MCKKGLCTQCNFPLPVEDNKYGCGITLVLVNGNTMDITICDDCLENIDFKIIWQEELNAWKHEVDTGLLNQRQRKISINNLINLIDNVPIGLFAVRH